MSKEKKLAEEFARYQELAKNNKNIDVAALMMNAIESQKANQTSTRQKRWAYLISVGLPPFGLIFAAKFYFSGKDDGKSAALVCVILTVISLIIAFLIGLFMFSSSGTSIQQLQQVNVDDLKQLLQ